MEQEVYCWNCMEATGRQERCPHCGRKAGGWQPQAHQLPPGTLLVNKYQIGRVLGEGGFGITYIGRDLTLDMVVAIKEYYPTGFVNRTVGNNGVLVPDDGPATQLFNTGKKRFLEEARSLAKFCDEPGIVGVRDFFTANNTAYIIMHYLDGITLKEHLKQSGAMDYETMAQLMKPMLKTLSAIHETGIIHRDISPDNLMLMPDGTLKLLDFGAARSVADNDDKSRTVMLKPGYAPEEQYRRKGRQGPWTDVYSLCATMYKCLTNQTPEDSVQRVFKDTLAPPSSLGVRLTPLQDVALMKGLSCRPEERWQNVGELAAAMGLEGFGAPPATPAAPAAPAVPVHAAKQGGTVLAVEAASPTSPASTQTEMVPPPPAPQGVTEAISPADAGHEPPRQPAETDAGVPESETPNGQGKKQHKGLKIAAVAGGAALLVFIIVSVIWRLNSSATIGGEVHDNDENSISFYDVTLNPEEIRSLKKLDNLKTVWISQCQIDETIMLALSEVVQLESIYFDECTGLGSIDALATLPVLEELSISGCPMPSISKDFPSMRFLTFSQNDGLTALSFLSRFPGLITLTISDVKEPIGDFSPIGQLTALTSLSLQDSGVDTLSFVATLPELTALYAYNSDEEYKDGTMTNAIEDLTPLAHCPNLEYLQLQRNQIESLSGLEACPALRELILNDNQIKTLEPLAGTGSLQLFNAQANQLESLVPLADNVEMQELYVDKNRLTSLAGCEKMIKLATLHADGNQIADLRGIENNSILEDVRLNDNALSDISTLGKSGKTLQTIDVRNNRLVNLNGLEACTALQRFNAGNNQLTDIGSLSPCASMEALRLCDNQITDLSALKTMPQLAYLDVSHNRLSSIEGLATAANLTYIDLSHNQISNIAPLASVTGDYVTGSSHVNPDGFVLYLDHNALTDLSGLPTAPKYWRLSLYENPVADYAPLEHLEYTNVGGGDVSYGLYIGNNDLDLGPLANSKCSSVYCADIPLGWQVRFEQELQGQSAATEEADWNTTEVTFMGAEDLNALLAEDKPTDISSLGY